MQLSVSAAVFKEDHIFIFCIPESQWLPSIPNFHPFVETSMKGWRSKMLLFKKGGRANRRRSQSSEESYKFTQSFPCYFTYHWQTCWIARFLDMLSINTVPANWFIQVVHLKMGISSNKPWKLQWQCWSTKTSSWTTEWLFKAWSGRRQ